MRFNEKLKKELVKLINERILNHPENITFFNKHDNVYRLNFSDDLYTVEIYIHHVYHYHKDVEIDIHDKTLGNSLIFDSHQYLINPKDIKNMINSLIELYTCCKDGKER